MINIFSINVINNLQINIEIIVMFFLAIMIKVDQVNL